MKCPKCKEEIEELVFEAKVEQTGYFRLDLTFNSEWDTNHYGEWDNLKFFCPKCDKLLFKQEEKALNFLKGENKKC